MIYKNFKESQQEVPLSSQSQVIENGINFEKEVAKLLANHNHKVISSTDISQNFDFSFDNNNRKTLIEVKAWKKPPPPSFLEKVVARLNDAIETEGATELLLIYIYIPLFMILIGAS